MRRPLPPLLLQQQQLSSSGTGVVGIYILYTSPPYVFLRVFIRSRLCASPMTVSSSRECVPCAYLWFLERVQRMYVFHVFTKSVQS